MKDWVLNVMLFDPLALISGNETDPEKLQLQRIIALLVVILGLLVGWEVWKFYQKKRRPGGFFRFMSKVKLDVTLEKDKLYRPHFLTMTIQNIGKQEADLNAPIIEFRKIWTTRKFKVNGIRGQQVYPLLLYPGITHELEIETNTFYQYDREIKSYYWARIFVSDIEGHRWKSNRVKLRQSLVT